MHKYVEYIILAIIAIQIFFFVQNLLRMWKFGHIFSKKSNTWGVRHNLETGMVDGITGQGNSIFRSIIDSINKYLGNNSGSVIEFGLLKDAVDRHCDSVEDDISAQTPIPLYWGLAGTMGGVILGLWDLLDSNAIMNLMGSAQGSIDQSTESAAEGVNALLSGIAWAMVASICGIVLTTLNSILFKYQKLKEEKGKNSFLAWMQAELLPELPSDTSEALNNLVKNLNKFNNTFAENTSNLGNALTAVNESYAIQGQIIQAVHDMDVMKMAKANVRVLQELKECTDKLEVFNEYLTDIEGYTEAIHRFESQFDQQAERLHVLEEIRDFFGRHKQEIAKTVGNADYSLQQSLQQIRQSTTENVDELHARFVEQSEQFKTILREEKDSFEQLNQQIKAQFNAQLQQMPQLAKQLEEVAAIPGRLDRLIEKMEKSNSNLAADVSRSIKQAMHAAKESMQQGYDGPAATGGGMPAWMKFSGWLALIIIAAACVYNFVIGLSEAPAPVQQTQPVQKVQPAPQVQPAQPVQPIQPAPQPADTIK